MWMLNEHVLDNMHFGLSSILLVFLCNPSLTFLVTLYQAGDKPSRRKNRPNSVTSDNEEIINPGMSRYILCMCYNMFSGMFIIYTSC